MGHDNAPVNPAQKWLTVSEVAQVLRVSPRTVRRMVARGELVGHRLGSRAVRVRATDLEALLRPIPNAESGRGVVS